MRLMVLWAVLAFVVLGSVEIGSALAYQMMTGRQFSFAETAALRAMILETEDLQGETPMLDAKPNPGADTDLVVHPFLGYIQAPTDKWVTDGHDVFYDMNTIVTAADPQTIVVGIFGGSFAEQFSSAGIGALKLELAKHPAFAGKTIRIVPTAFAGYKQPQQLIALNYLLSLGAHFDVIINIDGFNEVALSTTINGKRNVSPFFPSSWGTLVDTLPDMPTLRQIGKLVNLRSLRKTWASGFETLGSLGITPNVIWMAGDRRFAASIASMETDLDTTPTVETDTPLSFGPKGDATSDIDMLQALVANWSRSSKQMGELAAAKGIPYIHFLQPNQYVPESKPMSAPEARTAVNPASPYAPWVVAGYPLLSAAGNQLYVSGEKFFDLSNVFSKTEEPVYGDDCCHLTTDGYAMIGAVIGKLVVSTIATR